MKDIIKRVKVLVIRKQINEFIIFKALIDLAQDSYPITINWISE